MSSNDSNKNKSVEKSTGGSVTNANAFWKNDWLNAQSSLFSLRNSLASFLFSSLRIMRVSQLDADLLDSELFETFKEQLWLLFSVNIC
jgi:peroxin-2